MKISEIFRIICDELNLGDKVYEEQIGDFFALLATEKRFIQLSKGFWDLRENHSFEKVHIDMNEIYSESEEEIIEVDEGLVAKVDTNEELFEEEADEVEEEK